MLGSGVYSVMQKLNFTLMLAAGLLGGLLSRYVTPARVLAQAPLPVTKELSAQSFVLTDETGNIIGAFKPSADPNHRTVVFVDRNGRETWRAGYSVKALSEK
jgi:hypothetical protein